MEESFLQSNFAERIGGEMFGKENRIYKFEKIKRAKKAAMEANPNIELIDMGVGEPDEMAYPEVVKTLCDEASKWENREYTDNGILEFRKAAAKYMNELYSVELDPNTEICPSTGSKSALAFIPAAFINPGDMIIMTTPGYPVAGTWANYLGGEVINLPLFEENNYYPQLNSLTEEQKRRSKLLYINYPNNPTGAVATKEFYSEVIKFAKENNILIISDAAYAPLTFDEQPLSILSLPGAKECAVELHSMSKGFNMTGWRLSWVCGNSLAINAFATIKDNADSGQFAAIQKASINALENHDEITSRICKKYQRRLNGLASILCEFGFNAEPPKGTFYLYVAIPKGTDNGVIFENAEQFSQWLIKEKLISAVPWDDVGKYIRFSSTFVAKGGVEEEKKVLNEFKSRLSTTKFVF